MHSANIIYFQMNHCQFHPDAAQFLGPMSEGRIPGPAGRFPCCGKQSYRFETLPGPHGCQYREHVIQTANERDRAIYNLAQQAAEASCLFERAPAQQPPISDSFWWTGITLMPYRSKQGLLPLLNVEGEFERR